MINRKAIWTICAGLVCGLFAVFPVYAGCKLPRMGVFRINGESPVELSSFKEMNLSFPKGTRPESMAPDEKGQVETIGWVRTDDDKILKFQEVVLQHNESCHYQLSFKTEEQGGVSFGFEGSYYEKSQRRKSGYVQLRGKLRLLRNGVTIAESERDFEHWTSSDWILN